MTKFNTYLMTKNNDILYVGKVYEKILLNNFKNFEIKDFEDKKIVQVPKDVFEYWKKKLKKF